MNAKRKLSFWTVTALFVVVAMVVPWTVFADVVVPDGDIVTPGNQGTVNLGNVSPGAVITTQVSFQLECSSKNHVDYQQIDTLTFTSQQSSWPTGGNLSAANATIGAIPLEWPDDSKSCPTPNPVLSDSGDSAVTITAPTTPGSYSYVVMYDNILSPAGESDTAAIQGRWTTVTFNLTVVSDGIPPTASPTQSPLPNANGWNNTDVTVTWNWADNVSGSGIDTANCTTTSTSSSEGTIKLDATCKDLAGNTGTAEYTIYVDKTKPTISAVATTSPNSAGWYNSGVTVHFTCYDALSGIPAGTCPADQVLSTEGEDVSSTAQTVTDAAGNTSDPSNVVTVKIDRTKPTISAAATTSPNSAGWYNSDVTVHFTCYDALSGIPAGMCPADQVLNTEGKEVSSSEQTVTDAAGNTSDPSNVVTVKIDKTKPTITWNGGPADGVSYYFGFVPLAPTCAANDSLSGPNGCTVIGYGTDVGSHTMTATGYDVAGNSKAEYRSYTVLAWTLNGFYQPVDMNGVWNTVKGGSTVPLKFEVFAGDTELTDVSVVKSFAAKPVACPTTGIVADEIEFTTTGGTALRYDITAGQFIQNWQTPKKPGSCYAVTMTTWDGSTLVANFKLK